MLFAGYPFFLYLKIYPLSGENICRISGQITINCDYIRWDVKDGDDYDEKELDAAIRACEVDRAQQAQYWTLRP